MLSTMANFQRTISVVSAPQCCTSGSSLTLICNATVQPPFLHFPPLVFSSPFFDSRPPNPGPALEDSSTPQQQSSLQSSAHQQSSIISNHQSSGVVSSSNAGQLSKNSLCSGPASSKRTKKSPLDLKCPDCDKVLTSVWGLKTHIRSHRGEKPFKCQVCSYSCVTSSALVRHKRKHSGEKPYKCELCSKFFRSAHSLRLHSKLHSAEKPHTCHLCGKKFIQKKTRDSHLLKHNIFSQCHKSFNDVDHQIIRYESPSKELERSTRSLLSDKISVEINENCLPVKKLRCDHCPFFTSDEKEFKFHKSIHAGMDSKYQCIHCYNIFSDLVQLHLHVPTHFTCQPSPTNGDFTDTSDDDQDDSCNFQKQSKRNSAKYIKLKKKLLICRLCHHEAADERCLSVHEKIHLNKPALQCPKCSRNFWLKYKYNRHVSSHSKDIKQYWCKLCFKSFSTYIRMHNHRLLCSFKKHQFNYNCPECDHHCPNLSSLKNHIQFIHSVQLFQSDQLLNSTHLVSLKRKCNQMEQSSMNTNLLPHSQKSFENAYQCMVCAKKYATSADFIRHWRICRSFSEFELPEPFALCDGKNIMICALCLKTFPSAFKLMAHELRHHFSGNETIFGCRDCYKNFSSPEDCFSHYLRSHQRNWFKTPHLPGNRFKIPHLPGNRFKTPHLKGFEDEQYLGENCDLSIVDSVQESSFGNNSESAPGFHNYIISCDQETLDISICCLDSEPFVLSEHSAITHAHGANFCKSYINSWKGNNKTRK